MIKLNAIFNPQDVRDFKALMAQREQALDVSGESSIRTAMIKLVTALRSSTKQSPKLRPVRTVKVQREWSKKSDTAYAVERAHGGTYSLLTLPMGTTKAEAMESPLRVIQNRGLAKSSWGWILKKIGGKGSAKHVEIAGATWAAQRRRSHWFELEISDRLSYIEHSLKNGGKQAVSSAIRRAGTMLRKDTERAVARAIG